MKRGISLLMVLLLLLPLALPTLAQEQEEEEMVNLRIGLLPVMNAITFSQPWILGYYEQEGITVERVPFASAASLREAVAAGEVDGFLADLITALVLIEGGLDLRTVRHVEIFPFPMFAVIAHADSGIMSAEDLRGATIGLSKSTVVQYVADGMLASAGITPDEVEYVNVPGILNRADMLLAGEIQVATLPVPMWAKAVLEGHTRIVDDSEVFYVPEAYSFSAAVLAEKGDAVRAFFRAIERSVGEMNAFQDFDEGMAWFGQAYVQREQEAAAAIPGGIATRFFDEIIELRLWPNFNPARVPTEEEFTHAQEWALAAGLVSELRAYEDVIDDGYLPEVLAEEVMAESEDSDE